MRKPFIRLKKLSFFRKPGRTSNNPPHDPSS
jgi:hypothetical protein